MSRPIHIAALDTALVAAKEREREAAARLTATLDEHIGLLDAIDEVINERVSAYYDIGRCEEAIRKLGFCLLSKPHEGRLNIADEKEAARERANRATPTDDAAQAETGGRA